MFLQLRHAGKPFEIANTNLKTPRAGEDRGQNPRTHDYGRFPAPGECTCPRHKKQDLLPNWLGLLPENFASLNGARRDWSLVWLKTNVPMNKIAKVRITHSVTEKEKTL